MAKPVTMTVSHELGQEEAYRRIHEGFGRIETSLGMGVKVDHKWTDHTCHFTAKALGQTVAGEIEVRPEDIRIEVRLPALLAGMAEKITGVLKKESTLLLEKK